MFNRHRFCWLNSLNDDGFPYPDPNQLPQGSLGYFGEVLEATLCTDGVWRVLEAEMPLKIQNITS